MELIPRVEQNHRGEGIDIKGSGGEGRSQESSRTSGELLALPKGTREALAKTLTTLGHLKPVCWRRQEKMECLSKESASELQRKLLSIPPEKWSVRLGEYDEGEQFHLCFTTENVKLKEVCKTSQSGTDWTRVTATLGDEQFLLESADGEELISRMRRLLRVQIAELEKKNDEWWLKHNKWLAEEKRKKEAEALAKVPGSSDGSGKSLSSIGQSGCLAHLMLLMVVVIAIVTIASLIR